MDEHFFVFAFFLRPIWLSGITFAILNDHNDNLGVFFFFDGKEGDRKNLKSFLVQSSYFF